MHHGIALVGEITLIDRKSHFTEVKIKAPAMSIGTTLYYYDVKINKIRLGNPLSHPFELSTNKKSKSTFMSNADAICVFNKAIEKARQKFILKEKNKKIIEERKKSEMK